MSSAKTIYLDTNVIVALIEGPHFHDIMLPAVQVTHPNPVSLCELSKALAL